MMLTKRVVSLLLSKIQRPLSKSDHFPEHSILDANTSSGNHRILLLGLLRDACDGQLRPAERQRKLSLPSGVHKLLNSLQGTNQRLKRSEKKERS